MRVCDDTQTHSLQAIINQHHTAARFAVSLSGLAVCLCILHLLLCARHVNPPSVVQLQPFLCDWCECLAGRQGSQCLGDCFSPTCSSFPLPSLFRSSSSPLFRCLPLSLSPPGVSWTLSTLHHLIISWTCKCIHIHEGTDAKLTVAGTRCTVPTAQSASSTYREEGGRKRGVVAGGENAEGRERERELNKEGKKEKKTRDSDKKKKQSRGRGEEERVEERRRRE